MLALDDRPFSFDDICGQKLIVQEMKKRSLTKDFPTVMFFAGDSGTGKTTLALIIAALINDPNPLQGKDCLNPNPQSPESKAILSEAFNMSCSMYDASKMSKDDVAAMEDVISTESFYGGKRVLIVDECQELSKVAKGVTLKLLEKKRPNAHIILCTMNVDAFDISVRSRGLFYKFTRPTVPYIAEYLFGMIEKHRLTDKVPESFVSDGLFAIAENCEGSVRLAVQMFERCVTGNLFTTEAISSAFGVIDRTKLLGIVKQMLAGDKAAFNFLSNRTFDLKEFFYSSYKFISDCLVYLRTDFADSPWKADQFKQFAGKGDALKRLFDLYAGIDSAMGAFFKPSLCLARLSEICSMPPAGLTAPVRSSSVGYRTR